MSTKQDTRDETTKFLSRVRNIRLKWLHTEDINDADDLILDLFWEIDDFFNVPQGN